MWWDLKANRQRRHPFERKPVASQQYNKGSAGNERYDEPTERMFFPFRYYNGTLARTDNCDALVLLPR
jgi:hypothetical protein